MKFTWQLQEAKSKFREVVEAAIKHGPQIITKHGIATVVVLSYRDYRKLCNTERKDLYTFFQESPLVGVDLDLERDTRDRREDISP